MVDVEATRKEMISVIPVAQLEKCFKEEIDVLNSLCSHVKFRHYDFSDIENIVQEFQQLIDINFNTGNLKCHWRIRSPLMKERADYGVYVTDFSEESFEQAILETIDNLLYS